jgi:hypothetical protein
MGCKRHDHLFQERNATKCCIEHELLKNVVLMRGKGPCDMNYKIGNGDNESGLKEMVVSCKWGQAILQGAHVCRRTLKIFIICYDVILHCTHILSIP